MSNNPSNSVPDILRQLSAGFSTQVKVATKYWLALAVVSTLIVMATPRNGELTLPFFSISVFIGDFYPFVFILLSLLVIGYGSAHSQGIRTRMLIQRYIDSSSEKFLSNGDLHLQDVFDSLVVPSINRIAPLAQILQGKNQFYSRIPTRSTWRSILLGGYFAVLRFVGLLAIEIFPAYALIVSLYKGKLFSSDATPLNIPIYFFWFVGAVAFLVLIQMFILDISYSITSLNRICNCQSKKRLKMALRLIVFINKGANNGVHLIAQKAGSR